MEYLEKELMLIGASLYLCEGTKMRVDNRGWKHYDIEFTNTDVRLVKAFVLFMRRILDIDETRIRVQLFVSPAHVEKEGIDFWSRQSMVSEDNFTEPIRLKQSSGRYRPSKFGIAKVRYHSKEQFLTLQDIISSVFGDVA